MTPFDQDRKSRFYNTDPNDPDAPVLLDEWEGLRPGVAVRYEGTHALEGPFVVTEILHWDDLSTTVILNDGEYECEARNLVPLDPQPFTCPTCGKTSYHPEDKRQGYCGQCHAFTVNPEPLKAEPILVCRQCRMRAPWCSCGAADYA